MPRLLVMLAALLMVVVGLELREPAPPAAPAGPGEGGFAAATEVQRELPPEEAFAAIVQRPLFSPTRRPARPVDGEPRSPGDVQLGDVDSDLADWVLSGVSLARDGGLAVLYDRQADRFVRLRTGQTLAGWEVVEIQPAQVVLSRDEEQTELHLRRNSQPPRSGSGTAPPPREDAMPDLEALGVASDLGGEGEDVDQDQDADDDDG